MNDMTLIDDAAGTMTPHSGLQASDVSPVLQIVRAQPNINPDALQKLLDAEHQERRFVARREWMAAMTRFRRDVGPTGRSGSNTHLRSKYATIDDLLNAARAPLSSNGLTVRWEQRQERDPAWTTAVCIVSHRDGHEERTEFGVPVEQGKGINAAQAWGISSAYARRYALSAALGIAAEGDNDAQTIQAAPEVVPATERQITELSALIDKAETATPGTKAAFVAAYVKKYGAADNGIGVALPAQAVAKAAQALSAKLPAAEAPE